MQICIVRSFITNKSSHICHKLSTTNDRFFFFTGRIWVVACKKNLQQFFRQAHLFKPISQCLNTRSCQFLMWEAYGDALELTEVIYKLCHHISGLGVLKLHVPHPLESLTWPPVIPLYPSSVLLRGRPHVASWGKLKNSQHVLFTNCKQLQQIKQKHQSTWDI